MFRAICSFTILFIVALPLRAADEVKPNTLTPKEVEEGWILLFDGETTFGWTSKDGEKIAVEKGEITFPAEGDVSLRTTSSWSSFRLPPTKERRWIHTSWVQYGGHKGRTSRESGCIR